MLITFPLLAFMMMTPSPPAAQAFDSNEQQDSPHDVPSISVEFSCKPNRTEEAAPLNARCVRTEASFILQNPLDQPETLVVGWALQAVDFISDLMRILARQERSPTLVVLSFRPSIAEAHRMLSKFPEYAFLRRSGRLLIRPSTDRGNLWLQDAMEIGWNPRSKRNSVVDLPHFESDAAAATLTLTCGLGQGPLFADPAKTWPTIPESASNHGGNLEGLPGNLLMHGRGASRELLKVLRDADPLLETIEVDTKWLNVGHVDELFALVPTQHPHERCDFALLRASPGLAIDLMEDSRDLVVEPALEEFYGKPPEPVTTGTCLDKLRTSFDGTPLDAQAALKCRHFVKANRDYEERIARDAERLREAMARRTGCENIPIARLPVAFLPTLKAVDRVLKFESDHRLPSTSMYRGARSLNPNPVNGVSLGGLQLIPMQPNEAFRRAILEELNRAAPGLKPEFIATPHLHFLMGEAHCGTQVIRSCTSEL